MNPSLLSSLEPLPPNSSTWAAEWHIAWAQLRSRQHAALLNITTFLALSGVIVGVAVLNCVVAVMFGFEDDLQEKLIRSDAHIQITNGEEVIEDPADLLQRVQGVPGIAGAAPYVQGEVILRNSVSSTGVIVKGIDPALSVLVSDLPELLILGPSGALETPDAQTQVFETLDQRIRPGRPELDASAFPAIFLGKTLQRQLLISTGDKIQLINPVGQTVGLLGVPQPSTAMFRVAGVFESGQYEFDAKRVYIDIEAARKLLLIPGATGVELRVEDADRLDEDVAALERVVPPGVVVRDWRDLNRTLVEALHLQRYVMSLLLVMTIGVAALLIVSTLYMVVITKRSEIAILKALGASDNLIRRVFVMQGTFVGLVGVLLGTGIGLLGCVGLRAYGWPIDADVYSMATLPVVIHPGNVASIAVGAFLICSLFTLLPASSAASLDPVEGLRLE